MNLQFQAGTREGSIGLGDGLHIDIQDDDSVKLIGMDLEIKTPAPTKGQQVTILFEQGKLEVFFGSYQVLLHHCRQSSKNSPSET